MHAGNAKVASRDAAPRDRSSQSLPCICEELPEVPSRIHTVEWVSSAITICVIPACPEWAVGVRTMETSYQRIEGSIAIAQQIGARSLFVMLSIESCQRSICLGAITEWVIGDGQSAAHTMDAEY